MRKKAICFKWLLNALFVVVFLPTLAQNVSDRGLPFVTNYSSKIYKGTPTNWSVMQGDDGLMYFGQSNQGSNIIQYDGVKWNKIPAPPSSIICRAEAKDKDGTIYFGGSADFGYLEKDSIGKTRQHSLLQYIPKEKRNFVDVWSIQVAGNDIYFQSRERLFRLTKTRTSWKAKTWEPSTQFMHSFYLDDVLYVHEQNVGLLKMVNDSLTLIEGSRFLGADRMQVMLPYVEEAVKGNAPQKEYLCGTFTHGLYLFDGKNFKHFKTEADSVMSKYMVYRGIRIKDNYLFSLLGYGLVMMNPQGKIVQILNTNSGLASNIVYGVYADSKGNLWLALDNGISKININSPFTTFTVQSGLVAAPLSMARLNDGSFYVGTNNGLLKFNPGNSHFEVNNQMPLNQIFDLLVDGNTLLVPNDGLFVIKNGKTILVHQSVASNFKSTSLLIPKKYPNLLFVGTSSGASLLLRNNSSLGGWEFIGNIPAINREIFSLAEDDKGRVWAENRGGKSYRITPAFDAAGKPDISKMKVEIFDPEQDLHSTLSYVFKLENKVYFVGDSATYTFSDKNNHFEKAMFHGLSNFSGIADSTGKIWMTSGGLDDFKLIIAKPKGGGNYDLDSMSLLPVIDKVVSNSTVYPDKKGIVWFNYPEGLIRYDQNIGSKIDEHYKVLMRSVTAGKQQLNPDLTASKSPEIKSADNSLNFQYAAPFYEQEDKTQYQTWLEGFEKTWSDWGNNTYKEYTNLSPANYTFHVRAKNLYHTVSGEAVYSFIVLPPWYRTWWAYLSYLLIFALIIFVFAHMLRNRVIAKEREQAEYREAKLRADAENERRKNVELISEMGKDITGSLSIEHIIDTVYSHVNKLMDASVFGIGIINKETHKLDFPATKEKGETLKSYSYDLDDKTRPASWCFNNKKEILINDFAKEHQLYITDISEAKEGENPESMIYLPLIYKNKSIGVLTAQSFNKNAYSDYHLNILRSLATYTALALDNADAYRALQSTQAQLIQSEKMASLGELTAGIAHEIQNPLNFVNNFSEVSVELADELKDELNKAPLPQNEKENIESIISDLVQNQKKINQHGKRADAIVKSMLQHSRISTGQKESTDINALADEYLRLSYHGLRAKDKSFNATLQTDFDKSIEKINIIPQDIGRVLLNLFNNAFYTVMEKKKNLTGLKDLSGLNNYEPTVSVCTKKVDSKIEIHVKDNGNGVPQKVLDKIFQPFFTTKRAGEGTGLGLSLSYDIIKAHGGDIKVITREGEGAEFIIQLPV